jgi:hypothetical protein
VVLALELSRDVVDEFGNLLTDAGPRCGIGFDSFWVDDDLDDGQVFDEFVEGEFFAWIFGCWLILRVGYFRSGGLGLWALAGGLVL